MKNWMTNYLTAAPLPGTQTTGNEAWRFKRVRCKATTYRGECESIHSGYTSSTQLKPDCCRSIPHPGHHHLLRCGNHPTTCCCCCCLSSSSTLRIFCPLGMVGGIWPMGCLRRSGPNHLARWLTGERRCSMPPPIWGSEGWLWWWPIRGCWRVVRLGCCGCCCCCWGCWDDGVCAGLPSWCCWWCWEGLVAWWRCCCCWNNSVNSSSVIHSC